MDAATKIRTARLVLRPVIWRDLNDMSRLKANPGAFGQMLGGVRSFAESEAEMASDVAFWARLRVGVFTIRHQDAFIGMTGVHERPDGRGIGLRFALWPWATGRGFAREAAQAVLSFTHDRGIERVIGVARDDNHASRTILGGIGMRPCGSFLRDGALMMIYESVRPD